jgi:hypothetical protein
VKKVFLGDKYTSTVYAAELKGIYLALKIAKQELGTPEERSSYTQTIKQPSRSRKTKKQIWLVSIGRNH